MSVRRDDSDALMLMVVASLIVGFGIMFVGILARWW